MLEFEPMSTLHRFSDWRGLRNALGFTQHDMARLLSMSDRGYEQMERHGVRPAREQTIDHLRFALLDPTVQKLLVQSGYPNPFPSDVETMRQTQGG